MHSRSPLLLTVLLAASCGGPMMGAGDPGLVPLAAYNGGYSGADPLPGFTVAFVWWRSAPPAMDDLRVAGDELTIQGDDRSQSFWAVFYLEPPTDALVRLQDGEVRFARGSAVTIPSGILEEQIRGLPDSGNPAYGADVTHWMLFLEDDVPPGSLMEWWVGAPLLAGYHLMDVGAAPCLTEDQLTACVAELTTDRGVADEATARGFCSAPYRLTRVSWSDPGLITLGTSQLPPGSCP